jgi:Fe2+ transport system protein B
MPRVEETHGGLMQGPASLLILLGYALWIATVVWCVGAWGAFRQSFGATRAQAWITTSLWLALLAGVVWLGRHFG